MAARYMLALLLAEALAWVLLGAHLAVSREWGLGPALSLCAALSLGARVLIIGAGFAIARPRDTARDSEGWTAATALRAFGNELSTALRYYSVYGPFAPLGLPRDGPGADRSRPPLLLIHGYTCNRGVWWSLAPRLRAAGWGTYTIDLEPPFGSIDDYVAPIGRRIEDIRAQTGHERVVVLAHSMGGLAMRAYLARHGTGAVARVITLGTPHQGTRHAVLGLGENTSQMRCASPWLGALAAAEHEATRRLFTCIGSWTDNLVAPQTSAHLDGARNLALTGVAHLALLTDRDTQGLVLSELDALAAGLPDAAQARGAQPASD